MEQRDLKRKNKEHYKSIKVKERKVEEDLYVSEEMADSCEPVPPWPSRNLTNLDLVAAACIMTGVPTRAAAKITDGALMSAGVLT